MAPATLAPSPSEVRIRLAGMLDDVGAAPLRAGARELEVGARLVIDLRPCTFIDPVGIGALVGCIRRADAAGAHVSLVCEPGSAADQVLVRTGITGLLRRLRDR